MNATIVSATPENLYVASATAWRRSERRRKQNGYFLYRQKKKHLAKIPVNRDGRNGGHIGTVYLSFFDQPVTQTT